MKVMTIKVNTLKNGKVRLRVMTIRLDTLFVSWYGGFDCIKQLFGYSGIETSVLNGCFMEKKTREIRLLG